MSAICSTGGEPCMEFLQRPRQSDAVEVSNARSITRVCAQKVSPSARPWVSMYYDSPTGDPTCALFHGTASLCEPVLARARPAVSALLCS